MIQIIIAMTIAILRGGHDGAEHNIHQNIITIITNMMTILILIIFTYSHSDSKIKTHYVRKQHQQNINCHSQCDDQIHYYKMST
jgi:hypothetical protein